MVVKTISNVNGLFFGTVLLFSDFLDNSIIKIRKFLFVGNRC